MRPESYDRSFSNAPGFEGVDLTATFEVYSWGSHMSREHPGDPLEASVTLAWVEDGTANAPEFCPVGALQEWLDDQFHANPPDPDYEPDDYNYERDR